METGVAATAAGWSRSNADNRGVTTGTTGESTSVARLRSTFTPQLILISAGKQHLACFGK